MAHRKLFSIVAAAQSAIPRQTDRQTARQTKRQTDAEALAYFFRKIPRCISGRWGSCDECADRLLMPMLDKIQCLMDESDDGMLMDLSDSDFAEHNIV